MSTHKIVTLKVFLELMFLIKQLQQHIKLKLKAVQELTSLDSVIKGRV
jgi:hypothetical protein